MDNKPQAMIRPGVADDQPVSVSLATQPDQVDRQDIPTSLRSWHSLVLVILVCLFFALLTFCAHFVHIKFPYENPPYPSPYNPTPTSAARVYIAPQVYSGEHFIYLANGWLQGHLYVDAPSPADASDYTFWHGHWYVAFPPLPAVFFLPLVAIFHYSNQFAMSVGVELAFGIVNCMLVFLVLRRLVEKRLVELSFSSVAWLLVFFVFGTELLYVSMQASVWFLAHVIATTFLLLHVLELLGKRRGWLAAFWLGLAALSRSTALLAFPCYLLLVYLEERRHTWLLLRKCSAFCAVLALFVGGMLLYNLARFGSWLDFGYMSMNVSPRVADGLHQYGQFNLHFLATNFYYMLIQPPQLLPGWPFVLFDPMGTGIFWTMPALYSMVRTFLVRPRNYLAWSLLAGCILPLIALFLYYNTGWFQFGYRFFVDILPLAFILAVMGFHARLRWYEQCFILLSIGINVWGLFEYTYLLFFLR
ncbi:hypothetical protein [Dictyobacter formicarum]|uniref:Glycosyltransferase RgtA/B/C/D-like domain-containing protein n=1 Tax=Dictyobacter formicarum TaxID=2778368 RepID=A0ABQ3VGQ6_9CHLR|nr:hypothetical protein [Dictyobacter formicarum]GHO85352.1 hypothetical protein KSZ_33580 [Dictyobacter formicarum]